MKIKNKTYDNLKFIAMVVLPAVATLYTSIAEIWGLPFSKEIPLTIMAIDTCLGSLLMISTNNYNKDNNKDKEA